MPQPQVLHLPTRSTPALVLGLIEEFRAPLADLIAFPLFAALRHRDGWWQPAPGGSVRLELETRRLLIERFESRLHRASRYRPSGNRERVGRFFELQARALARHIQHGTPLTPAW